MSRSFSVHTVCVCALFCRVIMCWSLVASNLPVTTHTHTSTHKHTHRPVGCWGAGSASLWASSECQLPAAVCAERTVQRKRNVFPHPSASLCTAEACCSTVTPHWTLLWLTHSHTHTLGVWKLLVQLLLYMLGECTIPEYRSPLCYVCGARISLSLLTLLNFIFSWMWQFLSAQNSQVWRCRSILGVVV